MNVLKNILGDRYSKNDLAHLTPLKKEEKIRKTALRLHNKGVPIPEVIARNILNELQAIKLKHPSVNADKGLTISKEFIIKFSKLSPAEQKLVIYELEKFVK